MASFYEHMYQLLCPAASGGAEPWTTTSFGQYPRHPRRVVDAVETSRMPWVLAKRRHCSGFWPAGGSRTQQLVHVFIKRHNVRNTSIHIYIYIHIMCIYIYINNIYNFWKCGASTGCCLRRVRILENGVLQPGAASGGSESWKMKCFNRVLPPAGQNPGKWRLFDVSKASNTFPQHPRGLHSISSTPGGQ